MYIRTYSGANLQALCVEPWRVKSRAQIGCFLLAAKGRTASHLAVCQDPLLMDSSLWAALKVPFKGPQADIGPCKKSIWSIRGFDAQESSYRSLVSALTFFKGSEI